MKTNFILFLTLLLVTAGCCEEDLTPTEVINVFDIVQSGPLSAGDDISISQLHGAVTLRGMTENQNERTLIYWKKISGGNAVIESPEELKTVISGLHAGMYIFRLTRIDGSVSISDDVVIKVKRVKHFVTRDAKQVNHVTNG